MPIQVTFQLDNARERADMAKYISAIEGNQYLNGNRQMQSQYGRQIAESQDVARVKELEKEKKELQEEIKIHQQNNIKNEEKINKLNEELNALRDENENKIREAEDNKKLFEEACEENKKIKQEYELKLQEKDAEKKREINRVIDFRKGEERKLQDKIDELLKQLEIYNPSLNMRTNAETSYYKVDGNMLVETNIKDAPYMAQGMGDNKYRFQFNFEKGPIQEACANKDNILLPFCDILEEAENPSIIRPAEWGTATMMGGDLKVETKAKIKLYRD
jgi:chromosome segregation ATPase